MKSKDVTKQMDFGFNDEEFLPIEKCVCGKEFPYWSFFIDIYENNPTECPYCKRKFFFSVGIRIYEVIENG